MLRLAATLLGVLVAALALNNQPHLSAATLAPTLGMEPIATVHAGISSATLITDVARQAADDIGRWIQNGYSRYPAIMIGLAGLLFIPPMALFGLMVHRLSLATRPTTLLRPTPAPDTTPGTAWIILEGEPPVATALDRDLTQIGRQDDNDVWIDDETVHRYHAVIERDRAIGFVISDMSGPEGNGMLINGAHRATWSLADGDIVQLGKARLRFSAVA